MFKLTRFICLILILQLIKCLEIHNLTGIWSLHDSEEEYVDLTATVPGGIYSDLMDNNVIGDIFAGNNDVNTRWVAKKDWIYKKKFIVSRTLLSHSHINLILEGIDTISSIDLNGVTIGTTENMFVRYNIDIKEYLTAGENILIIYLYSPIHIANSSNEEFTQIHNYTIPPNSNLFTKTGECNIHYLRKMQASFGWDFAPAFPSVGIWKNIYIESYNSTLIRDITVSIKPADDNWDILITTYLAKNKANTINGSLQFVIVAESAKIKKNKRINLKPNAQNEFVYKIRYSVPKKYFKLWWPNGYGEQHLYDMKVRFKNANKSEHSVKQIKIGFRSIELIQKKVGSGKSFYFKVNEIPIFMKGSNFVPTSILPEKSENATLIKYLLESCRAVHMNMLRVWGGGIYESNTFYEMADRLGILIWQDFMFACSMYPAHEEFLNNVKEEVKQQVRRLQHHASLAIWAGNNENEIALTNLWYGHDNKEQLHKDYIKLYVETIKKVVLENDKTHAFLLSSPSNADGANKDPQSTLFGDVHYFFYGSRSWNQSEYNIPRFCSEYGYQSFPFLNTSLESEMIILGKRSHFENNWSNLLTQFGLSVDENDIGNSDLIYYSQIDQAMSVKIETEHYRVWRGDLNQLGEGMTMGALYWQLNDVWVAPSWSSIDFNGKWKMLHYYARDFFAPIIITTKRNNKYISIYVVSDLLIAIRQAKLKIYIYNWKSFVPVKIDFMWIDIMPGTNKIKVLLIQEYLLQSKGCGDEKSIMKECFIYLTLTYIKQATPSDVILFEDLRLCSIRNNMVQIESVDKLSNNVYMINISSNHIAAFVWLNSDYSGTFSENGFFQLSRYKIVNFTSNHPKDINNFSAQNYVSSFFLTEDIKSESNILQLIHYLNFVLILLLTTFSM